MKDKFSWAMMIRVIMICGFISVPAIIISGYAVYSLRNWLFTAHAIKVSDPIYLFTLFLVMWGVVWLTAGKLIGKIREQIRANQIEHTTNNVKDSTDENGIK